MNEDLPNNIFILLLLSFVSIYFFRVLYLFLETIFGSIFHKPFYVHCYLFPKKLIANQIQILNQKFDFYKKLPPKRKRYFEHRVAVFLQKYPFHGREGLIVTDEMKVLIAATSTMLTFGMQKYLYTVFNAIVLYPDVYYSQSNEEYHKGEFNARLKTLVFSWKHFQEGYELSNDNLNLGLHEFSHTLHFQSLKSSDISSSIYHTHYKKLLADISHPPNRERLVNSHYFRDYAYSNQFEFIAVVLENFFETPKTFQQHFPELYLNVKRMINYNEL